MWAIITCLSRLLNRKLDWKQSNKYLKSHSNMEGASVANGDLTLRPTTPALSTYFRWLFFTCGLGIVVSYFLFFLPLCILSIERDRKNKLVCIWEHKQNDLAWEAGRSSPCHWWPYLPCVPQTHVGPSLRNKNSSLPTHTGGGVCAAEPLAVERYPEAFNCFFRALLLFSPR